MIGAVLVDEVLQLVVGVDEGIEIEPLQIGRRHLLQVLAAIRPRRGGVVDAPGISRQQTAAMGDDDLEAGILIEDAAKDQMMHGDRRIEWVADDIGEVVVLEAARFGIAVKGPDGYVTRVVEKPKEPESNLAVVGMYYFKDSGWLYRAIHKLMDSGRSRSGEYFLADALQVMIDEGAKFITQTVDVWEDTGTPDAVLHSNRYLLRKMDGHTEPYMRGTSLVIPPCHIAGDATIENSVIGPYAAISEKAVIRDSIVKNSIVSRKAKISSAMLFGSIIGEKVTIEGSYQTLNIGDDSSTHTISVADAEIDETFK